MDVQHFKDALLAKRTEILGTGGIKPLQASMENNTRQGDMADQASGNNEVHIQLKLKQTDAKILQAIEEALTRIDKGTYGVCRDCGEPIADARLKAIPWKVFPVEHLAGVGLTAALVAAIGVLSSVDVLRNKPLATLRAE